MKELFFIFYLITLLFSCSSKNIIDNNNKTDIIIYGTDSCGACAVLKQSLDKENIRYVFYDINDNEKRYREMIKLGKKAVNYYTVIYYPVVKIRNTVILRPSVEEIKNILK